MNPVVRPFSGRIVDPAWSERVVSPMFDVLTVDERRAVLDENPDSFLQVISDRVDDRATPGAPTANAVALQRLLRAGAFRPEAEPGVFAYRMSGVGGDRTGLVVQVAVAGFADRRVLGHEGVQPERVERLVRLVDAVPARSELVSLVHPGEDELAGLIDDVGDRPPLLAFTDFTGIRQAVWRLDPPAADRALELLGNRQLYIADGHHRVAAALTRWERDGRPDDSTLLCVAYAQEQVQLFAFYRRIGGPVSSGPLMTLLSNDFRVDDTGGPTVERGAIGMYGGGSWCRLSPRDDPAGPGVAGLDVTLLDARVLRPLLGIEPGDHRLEFIPELRDIAAATAACDRDGGVLFTVAAPSIIDLMEVADRGETMSAKSTYVEPKPRIGVFLH